MASLEQPGTPRSRHLARWAALKSERSSWLDHWRSLSDHVNPRRSRFLSSDRNKATQNTTIINSTPTRAAQILTSGMMAAISSPARPWFRLTTPTPALAEVAEVRAWLHEVEELVREVFARSNLYDCLREVYDSLAIFGVAALHVEEDEQDILRGYVFPVGQYALATSATQRVDTVYRELSMTCRQIVQMFGLDVCSDAVKTAHKAGNLDQWFEVLHVITPNADYRPGKIGNVGKQWTSCWLETKGGTGLLRESGYAEMPVVCPRWEVTGEDVYGRCPAMHALGDCKELQHHEKSYAKAIDKTIDPPMLIPSAMQHRRVSLLPGDTTPVDGLAGSQRVEPAMTIDPKALTAIETKIAKVEARINSAFLADLWLMQSTADGRMTATEVAARQEEKMLQLGPVLHRFQNEGLNPLFDRVFSILLRLGLIPEPPEELDGVDLKIEYLSIVETAQRVLAASSVERWLAQVGSILTMSPDAIDKVDVDEVIDGLATALSIPPDMVRSDENVVSLRKAREQRLQAQQQGEAMMAATQGAANLAGAGMADDNALTRIAAGMGVVPAPGQAAGAA